MKKNVHKVIAMVTTLFALLSTGYADDTKKPITTPQSTSQATSSRPNFVVLLADDISWDAFGCTNPSTHIRTPNIDKLATEGMRLTSFHCATAICVPTRHEFYTGLLPPTSGVRSNSSKPIESFKSVRNFFDDLGYVSGRSGKTHFYPKPNFDRVESFEGGCNSPDPAWHMDGAKKFVSDAVAKNLNFCLFLCSVHAHHPWTMGDQSHFPVDKVRLSPHMVDTPKTREAIARHAAEVEEFDKQVGATMAMLKEMNLEKNTVLIVLSEQGTSMPRGKWTVYEYGNRALAILRWPGVIAPGSLSPAISQYCDIVPTMVEMAGGKPPEGIDGRSLLKALKGETTTHRKYAFLCHDKSRAIVGEQYKLVWNPEGKQRDHYLKGNDKPLYVKATQEWVEKAKTDPTAKKLVDLAFARPEFELFDIQQDPYEMVDLSKDPKYAEVLKTMSSDLKAEMALLKDTIEGGTDNEHDEDSDDKE